MLASPATRVGAYDVIGSLTLRAANGVPTSSRLVTPGEFTMTSGHYFDDDPLTYTLNVPPGILSDNSTSINVNQPFLSWIFNIPPTPSRSFTNGPTGNYCCQYLGEHLTAFSKAADGSETEVLSYDFARGSSGASKSISPTATVEYSLDYDIGYSYVAMGEWSWRVVDTTAAGGSGDLLFVNGDRTASSGIPVSGTATYDARTFALLSSSGKPGIPFTLTADFGQRIMSTRIDQNYQYNSADPTGDPILGIHIGGSSSFSSSGLFDIPLSGTVNYANTNLQSTPSAEPVTGAMNGAFFGPHAEQVGGTFSLQRSDQTQLIQDAFVGKQRGP